MLLGVPLEEMGVQLGTVFPGLGAKVLLAEIDLLLGSEGFGVLF